MLLLLIKILLPHFCPINLHHLSYCSSWDFKHYIKWVERVNIIVLFLILVGILCFSLFIIMFPVDLCIAFIMLWYRLCIIRFSRTFTMKDVRFYKLPFLIPIMWFLSLSLLTWSLTFMLNHLCTSGMKPTKSWWMIFLIFSWIWFARILLSIFAPMIMREIGL